MTQEDKELLLKDLCARLPYSVQCCAKNNHKISGSLVGIIGENVHVFSSGHGVFGINVIKPYLFPLSSMTDRQAKEIQEIVGNSDDACIIRKTYGLELWLNSIDTDPTIWVDTIFEVQDYLNKNHFDYRDLIEKGLAIDATGLNIY